MVAPPSPSTSPPTLSSRMEVRVTGLVEVPSARRVPFTVRVAPEAALMMVPPAMVRVALVARVMPGASIA